MNDSIQQIINYSIADKDSVTGIGINVLYIFIGALITLLGQLFIDYWRNKIQIRKDKKSYFSDLVKSSTRLIESYCDVAKSCFLIAFYKNHIELLLEPENTQKLSKEHIDYLYSEYNKYQDRFFKLKDFNNEIWADFIRDFTMLDRILNIDKEIYENISKIKNYDINTSFINILKLQLNEIDINNAQSQIDETIKTEFGNLIDSIINNIINKTK